MITVHEGSHKSFLPNAIRSRIAAIGAGMSFRWSDVFDAPLHDFPIRDEILCQYLPLAAGADVLEVGPGSGFTAFRLARRVGRVTLLDVAPRAVDELRTTLGNIPNLQFVCAAAVYAALHEWPLRTYRRMRAGDKHARPQIYEATWAFQHRERLLPFKASLHLYWTVLGWAMRLSGRVFIEEPVGDRPLGRQLVIRARK